MVLNSGSVQLYALSPVNGSLSAQSLHSVSPTLPSAVATAAAASDGGVECIAFCPSTSTLAVAGRACGIQLLDSNGRQSSASAGWSVGGEQSGVGVDVTPSLCWSSDGFSLLANAASCNGSALPRFLRYSVLQAVLPQSATARYGRPLLLGADRLHLPKRIDVPSFQPHQAHAGRRRAVQRSGATHTAQLPARAERIPLSRSQPDSTQQHDEEDDEEEAAEQDEAAELSADPLLSSSFDCLLSEWDVLHLPAGYASHACPIRCVSVSESGEHVAVAGSRGLCVWTQRTRKWRQLASLREEWTLRPQHIAWLADHSIVVHSRGRQHSRQHWVDTVPRDKQQYVQSIGNGLVPAEGSDQRWSLSPSPSALPLLSSSWSSHSLLVSDLFVFSRSQLSFASLLSVVAFPAHCRLCEVLVSGSSLLVRSSEPASLLFHFTLTVAPSPSSSRQPPRLSVSSSSATPPLPSPTVPSPAILPLPRSSPATSIISIPTPASPLSLPSSATLLPSAVELSGGFSSPSSSLCATHPSLTALLPPSWRSTSRSTASVHHPVVAAGSVQCSLQTVERLPIELRMAGLHRRARQILFMPRSLPASTPARHLLLLLSTTGQLHCTALNLSTAVLPSAAAPFETGTNDGEESGSASWLAASDVSAVWPQPMSTLSPLMAASTGGADVAHQLDEPIAAPLLLTFGLHGLHVIQLRPPGTGLPSSTVASIPLSSDCYPVAVDWNAGCVLTLRSYRHSQDEPTPSTTSLLAHALSLQSIPFLHTLLSACLSRPRSASVPSASGGSSSLVSGSRLPAGLLWAVLRLLRCVAADSALLALELFLHFELVSEHGPLAALPASQRPSRVAAVHSLLAAVARRLPNVPSAYERVLAHVARKTDSSLWSRLFDLSGTSPSHAMQQEQERRLSDGTEQSEIAHFTLLSPSQLAATCLAHGELHAATLYLLLVQRTGSPAGAHLLAVQTLQLMERRRHTLTMAMDRGAAGAVELSQLEVELELSRQVRRFAQQTAAIVLEQQQQQEQTKVPDSRANSANGCCAADITISDAETSVREGTPSGAKSASYSAAQQTQTEGVMNTSVVHTPGQADIVVRSSEGDSSTCVLQ